MNFFRALFNIGIMNITAKSKWANDYHKNHELDLNVANQLYYEKLVSMTIEIRERHNSNISFEVFRFFFNFLLLDGNKKLHNKLADMPL